jgi:hypothetical protein
MKKPPSKQKQTWKNSPRPWHGSFFYGQLDLDNLDNRTNVAKAVRSLQEALREYTGAVSVLSEILINQIIYKAVKLHFYTASCLQDLQNVEAPHYLPMANSLRLDLEALAKQAGSSKPLSLEEYLNTIQEAGR